MRDQATLTRQLTELSYAVLPGYHDPEIVARARGTLEQIYQDLGAPPLWSAEPRWIDTELELSNTGFIVHKLLRLYPTLLDDLLRPDVIELLRAVLGEDMHIEYIGGVICDHTRPFFKWHNHIGGIDDEKYRRSGERLPIEKPERVAMLNYLDPMGPTTGQLLIHPHRVSGSLGPPKPVERLHWEGEVAVEGPPGTVAFVDQTNWHAALPRTIDGQKRMFIGCWFAASCVPQTERVDESLLALESADPLLRSLVRGGLPPA